MTLPLYTSVRLDSLKNCPYFTDVPCLIHLAQRAKESLKLRKDRPARIFSTHLFLQILDCGFSVQKQPVIVVPYWICAAVRLEAVWLQNKAEKRQNIDGSPAVQKGQNIEHLIADEGNVVFEKVSQWQ